MPGAVYIAWASSVVWIVPSGLIFMTVAIFPDGQFPSPRWRWVPGLILLFVASTVMSELIEQPMESAFGLANPFPLLASSDTAYLVLNFIAGGSLLLVVLAVAATAVVRFRRARGAERQQFKWLVWSLLVALLLIVAGIVLRLGFAARLGEVMLTWSIAFPIFGISFAILRYRLYDIDVIINRTLVYSTLTLALTAVYIGSIVLL